MSFYFGDQNAGIINNVGGNQYNAGGQQGTVVLDLEAQRAVHDLRAGLTATTLDENTAAEARAQLAEIDTAMRKPEPDRSRIASVLKRLTRLLVTAGSLSTAGAALIPPLQILAHWLGTLGGPILQMLPALG
jgi:hypothetical protein